MLQDPVNWVKHLPKTNKSSQIYLLPNNQNAQARIWAPRDGAGGTDKLPPLLRHKKINNVNSGKIPTSCLEKKAPDHSADEGKPEGARIP